MNQKSLARRGHVLRIGRGECRSAVGLEEVGEDRIRVKRNVPEHVVEDVGLGEIIDGFLGTNDDGRRETPFREAREEGFRREVARDRSALPARQLSQESIDRVFPFEVGDVITHELDGAGAVEIDVGSAVREEVHLAVVQRLPGFLVLLGVAVVALGDEERRRILEARFAESIRGLLGGPGFGSVDHLGVEVGHLHGGDS